MASFEEGSLRLRQEQGLPKRRRLANHTRVAALLQSACPSFLQEGGGGRTFKVPGRLPVWFQEPCSPKSPV